MNFKSIDSRIFELRIGEMKRKLLTILYFFPFLLSAQWELSERAQISIITCGPGQNELYSAFGHSAVRVHDPEKGLDWVYNYGIFDFDQPNFYLNFAKGNLNYMLAVGYFDRFKQAYLKEGRFMHEQVLQLSPSQKQAYFDFLQHNAKEENRTYAYDYFYDNCATRIRDGLWQVLGPQQMLYPTDYVQTGPSIRQLCDLYLKQQPWGDWAIDFCLGLPMDKTAEPWEFMFLPDYLEKALAQTKLKTAQGWQPIVKEHRVLNGQAPQEVAFLWWQPWTFFLALLVLALLLTVAFYQTPRKAILFDAILYGVVGFLGIFLMVLWFFTDHRAAAQNLNLLVYNPALLVVVYLHIRQRYGGIWHWFNAIIPYYYAVIIAVWLFLPQQMHPAHLALMAVFMLRSWHLSYKLKKPRQ